METADVAPLSFIAPISLSRCAVGWGKAVTRKFPFYKRFHICASMGSLYDEKDVMNIYKNQLIVPVPSNMKS